MLYLLQFYQVSEGSNTQQGSAVLRPLLKYGNIGLEVFQEMYALLK